MEHSPVIKLQSDPIMATNDLVERPSWCQPDDGVCSCIHCLNEDDEQQICVGAYIWEQDPDVYRLRLCTYGKGDERPCATIWGVRSWWEVISLLSEGIVRLAEHWDRVDKDD